MKNGKWHGNRAGSFCSDVKTSHHLFFTCSVARIVWRSIGVLFGIELCPGSYWQFYAWCYLFWPEGECFYTVGLAIGPYRMLGTKLHFKTS